ncbi:hypothetical protein [uncultured Clostridium sp.]|uniref:hypothetical protein n=1 Tax=uncultured Clostridium sp. TaxID=59620 RepID=UPI0025D206F8|nr:hypothetical protein [uncultured Clostridium sp.]
MSLVKEKKSLTNAQEEFLQYRDDVNYKTMAIILYIEKFKNNKEVLKQLKKIKNLRSFEYKLIELCLNK